MKRITGMFFALLAIIMLLYVPVPANAASLTPIEDFEYTRIDAGSIRLTRYIGKSAVVTVPDSYYIDGISYQVELASTTVFVENAYLTSITISSGVTFENASMIQLFAKCTALKSVRIAADTDYVTDMSYLFYGCEALEKLDLSSFDTAKVTTMEAMFSHCKKLQELTGYENWDTSSLRCIAYMFNLTERLKRVDMSRWTLAKLENSGWCFQKCGASKILLPDDLSVISAGFLNHADAYKGSSFTVPAGVKKIGYAHTIYDFATNDFVEFRVAEGNSAYQAVDGILYSADGKEMLAIPRGKKFPQNTFEILEGTTFLGELSFSRNQNVETVMLPDSYILEYVPLYDPDYIVFEDTGNLNAGLNLNIAIYCYTGIKAYAVKDSNPNYKSVDGVLYTKDGNALVAIPTRYEGFLDIPEGVTLWQGAAMWNAGELVDSFMKKCTGVSIPATMTQISEDQIDKLNRLEKNHSDFKITVSEENPVYYIGKSGQLLKKSNLKDLEVTLSQDSYVFDGQPKTPDARVVCNNKTLKEGKDFTVSYWDNTNAGTAWIKIIGQGNYYGAVEYSFAIMPGQPQFVNPGEQPAIYGQTLSEIVLPDGFAWEQADMPVGDVGVHTFQASFTNGDPNYTTLHNIPIAVRVEPKKLGAKNIAVTPWCSWTGRLITPAVSVVDVTGEVAVDEYQVSFENNSFFGKGRVILQDVPGGNYDISGTVAFYIVPGPFLCIAVLTLLWSLTTGISIKKSKKVAQSERRQENL